MCARGLRVTRAGVLGVGVLGAVLLGASGLAAHEVRPAVGDLRQEGDRITLALQMSAEALVAGINLDSARDTDASDRAADYDRARLLPPDALAGEVRAAFPAMAGAVVVQAGARVLPLVLSEVEIGPVGNFELPRDSVLTVTAQVPDGAEAITVTWPKGYGELILRQQDVEDGVSVFLLPGDTSPPIPLQPAGAGGFLCSWTGLMCGG